MKYLVALALLAIGAATPSVAAGPDSKSEKDVAAVMETWRQAMLKGDAAALDKVYHQDLSYEHSSGKTETKSESIQNATRPGNVAKGIDLHDVTTHVYGNTAIVKCKANYTNGAGTTTHLDMLMVWLKSPQGWQLVARQSTKIP
ncbi:MAG TPA: nuclear transport factor 2 family protein [Bryobacteraceae bacterium]|nr:nuclear transport factor 2 family protein [Bryobacteraceae bacterium]